MRRPARYSVCSAAASASPGGAPAAGKYVSPAEPGAYVRCYRPQVGTGTVAGLGVVQD